MKTRLGASLALALSGSLMAAGVTADDKKETLDRIEAQTKRIEAQVTDPATGLPAVGARVDGVDTAVQKVGKDVTSAVGSTLKAVTAVQATIERLRGPANRVWVSPYWKDEESGERGGFPTPAHIISGAHVVVLNTGNDVAHVGCSFFSAAGNALLDRGASLTIGRGATGTCHSLGAPGEGFQAGSGWLIVHSDRPVLVSGWFYDEIERTDEHSQRQPMHLFPVDCDNPAGLEFVCDWARP